MGKATNNSFSVPTVAPACSLNLSKLICIYMLPVEENPTLEKKLFTQYQPRKSKNSSSSPNISERMIHIVRVAHGSQLSFGQTLNEMSASCISNLYREQIAKVVYISHPLSLKQFPGKRNLYLSAFAKRCAGRCTAEYE